MATDDNEDDETDAPLREEIEKRLQDIEAQLEKADCTAMAIARYPERCRRLTFCEKPSHRLP